MTDQATLQQSPVLRRQPSGQRTGPASDWAALDPILEDGEIGHDTTTGTVKIGDGVTRWSAIDGIAEGGTL